MEIKSTSKINIGLHIHNKRSDGFHNISTIFQEINLCDQIKIIEDKNFSCTTSCGTITEKDNFGTKAFNILKAQYPDIPNVRISIKKTIPTNAGLGGGSGNGTAVLVGLNNLFKLKLSNQKLSEMASKVSSDSAFFVNGGLQFGTQRGEILDVIQNIKIPKHILLIYPDIKISTKEAFTHLKNHLLNENMDINLSQLLRELNNNTFNSKLFKNDFEMYVFETHPEIGAIKLKILDFNAKYASLSGTGSTVFGIFSSKKDLLKAQSFFSPQYSTYYVNPI